MATYWDEGLETSVYRLQKVAAWSGNHDFQLRAKDLERRLETAWVPMFSSFLIKGDALKLGEEMAAATGLGRRDPNSANPTVNVLYDEDDTIGGRVGTVDQEAFVSGDVGAGTSAAVDDVASSARELATGTVNVVLPYARWILLALVVLIVFYVYERARR